MARIEHIRQRLENWALWRSRRDSHGLGYASRNVLTQWAAPGTRYAREAVMPVLHIDAQVTDDAVSALRMGNGHLYVTLVCIYLKGLGINGTAQQMRRSPRTIHAQLEQADRLINSWLTARHETRRRARELHE